MNQHSTYPEQSSPPAGVQRFQMETRIAAPPETVFRFHESPDALTQLIPPWENMRVAEAPGSLEPGSVVVLKGRVAGIIPVKWVALHTAYEPPHLFVDRQESGPFAYWLHHHRFIDDGAGGTLLRDEVDYKLPLGPIGQVFGGGFVRVKLDKMFRFRHEVTKRLVESGEWGDSQS